MNIRRIPDDFTTVAPGRNKEYLSKRYGVDPATVVGWATTTKTEIFHNCNKCKEDLPKHEFYADKTCNSGIRGICKFCCRDQEQERRVTRKRQRKLNAQTQRQEEAPAVVEHPPLTGSLNGCLGQLARDDWTHWERQGLWMMGE